MSAAPPQAKKSLGQHWLFDNHSLESICQAAKVNQDDMVLEIGPGQGTLSEKLLATGARVVALEFDGNLALYVRQKLRSHGEQLEVIEGDIRGFDLSQLPQGYKIVANIPYYLSANLLRKLTDTDHKPTVASLLVQKEVAHRVAAEPGQLSLIAVYAQFYYQVSLGAVVPAHLFEPPPKVDSQVLILTKRQQPLFQDIDSKKFFRLVSAGFSAPRKKLRSSLSGGLGISKSESENLLNAARIDPNKRAQELSLRDWRLLLDSFSNSPAL